MCGLQIYRMSTIPHLISNTLNSNNATGRSIPVTILKSQQIIHKKCKTFKGISRFSFVYELASWYRKAILYCAWTLCCNFSSISESPQRRNSFSLDEVCTVNFYHCCGGKGGGSNSSMYTHKTYFVHRLRFIVK